MIKIGTTEIGQVKLGETNVPFVKNGNKFVFPYDAEIEYLESTGTEYIDTMETITYNSTDTVEYIVNMAITSNASRQLNGDGAFVYFGVNDSNKFEIHQVGVKTYDSNYHNWYLFGQGNKTIIGEIDGVRYNAGSTSANNRTYNIYLFAIGGNVTSPSASFYIKQKLKNAIIKRNGEVVRDFIPVRIGQIGYLYDKVSGQLFGNAGTGDFILGPDKV
jgi:hypothetical protein